VNVRLNKFKTQGAPDHVAFLCDTLVEHGRRPTASTSKHGATDVAKALFTASQPFLQLNAMDESGYAD
jgi:hypothetical protein